MPVISIQVSPMSIDNYSLISVAVEAVSDFAGSIDEAYSDCVSVKTGIRYDGEKKFWVITLVVRAWPDDLSIPYRFDIKAFGEFSINIDGASESEREEFICRNAPSVLYGVIREMLSIITLKGPYGQITIPEIFFTYMKDDDKPDALIC